MLTYICKQYGIVEQVFCQCFFGQSSRNKVYRRRHEFYRLSVSRFVGYSTDDDTSFKHVFSRTSFYVSGEFGGWLRCCIEFQFCVRGIGFHIVFFENGSRFVDLSFFKQFGGCSHTGATFTALHAGDRHCRVYECLFLSLYLFGYTLAFFPQISELLVGHTGTLPEESSSAA